MLNLIASKFYLIQKAEQLYKILNLNVHNFLI